ncbi:hypothetical protein SH597_04590 [Lacticaseibacillus paracasei]|uniref:Uncharacterized protein n=1 Tax=Lacticaseibacillus paracasei TaxID=1597 RepID=A0ABD7BQP7_LACPA|nr:hypothetical protein [Lacticaseibacillus paracasei]ARE43371.1 hypothetical protein A3778_04330 [Lacticaseibacillus paracasei]QOP54914.1 hypothetical protein HCJ88_03610 [Lacticaseibacillus paracasei]QPB56478.1 hypothetical protein GFB64_04915 [Lacticaseibacillus paracasei]WPQ31536.1 hypothetical protein SH597_04590 [Lacticaseibacillus paracasei]
MDIDIHITNATPEDIKKAFQAISGRKERTVGLFQHSTEEELRRLGFAPEEASAIKSFVEKISQTGN